MFSALSGVRWMLFAPPRELGAVAAAPDPLDLTHGGAEIPGVPSFLEMVMARRYWRIRVLTLAVLGGFAAACGYDDVDPTEPIPEVLAGDWEASPDCRPPCAFTVIPIDNPADSISLLDLPASVQVSIHTGGGFLLRLQLPESELPLAGTARIEGSSVYITGPSGAVDTATYSIANDLLTLEYQNELRGVDFDDDGVADPGRVRAVLRRL